MKFFAESNLIELLNNQLKKMHQEVQLQDKDKLMDINEVEYVLNLVDRYHIEPLVLHWDQLSVIKREVVPTIKQSLANSVIQDNSHSPKRIITHCIPFSGTEYVLWCAPTFANRRRGTTIPVDGYILNKQVCFDIIDRGNDPKEILYESERTLDYIRQEIVYVNTEIDQFNNVHLKLTAQSLVRGYEV